MYTLPILNVRTKELNVCKQAFGINVLPKLITVPGRVLMNPTINYWGTKTVYPRSGSWNMQSVQFVTKADLPKWTYLRILLQGVRSPCQDDDGFHTTMTNLQTVLKQQEINLTNYMKG